jgi:hypothetical protein
MAARKNALGRLCREFFSFRLLLTPAIVSGILFPAWIVGSLLLACTAMTPLVLGAFARGTIAWRAGAVGLGLAGLLVVWPGLVLLGRLILELAVIPFRIREETGRVRELLETLDSEPPGE